MTLVGEGILADLRRLGPDSLPPGLTAAACPGSRASPLPHRARLGFRGQSSRPWAVRYRRAPR